MFTSLTDKHISIENQCAGFRDSRRLLLLHRFSPPGSTKEGGVGVAGEGLGAQGKDVDHVGGGLSLRNLLLQRPIHTHTAAY